jgi:hypothetical protein
MPVTYCSQQVLLLLLTRLAHRPSASLAAAIARRLSGCGPNCDKCGKYKILGVKQCRVCCWGDPVEEITQAVGKASCDVVATVGCQGYVAAAGVMSNRAGAAEKFSKTEKVNS